MINYLNRHGWAATLALRNLVGLGRLVGVDRRLLERAREIRTTHQVEYALGFVVWFIFFQLRWKLPAYNIYHLVGDDCRQFACDLFRARLHEYPVAKQYFLLQTEANSAPEFQSSLRAFLETALQSRSGNTAFKVRRFNTDKAFKALSDINNILRRIGLQPFLVSGTLLGVIRDGHLIEGDNDLDIGVMNTDSTAVNVFNRLLPMQEFLSVYNLGHLVQATHKNGTVIDIFIHYSEGENIWHGTDIHKWVNSCFGLKEIQFQSESFFIPDDPQKYLDENYGNWSNPVLFWDYSFDTPNRVFWPDRKTAYYLLERITGELARKSPSRFTVQKSLAVLRDLFGVDLSHYIAQDVSTDNGAEAQNKTVITFGTFDLFHIGHLNILKRAAAHGDRLVVGVSSDALNYSKKSTYPVYSQEDRLRIVEAIECVDHVFYEESLDLKREYIQRYEADLLVMGDDWHGKFDGMADVCEVAYLPRTESISTTETKDSIKRNL